MSDNKERDAYEVALDREEFGDYTAQPVSPAPQEVHTEGEVKRYDTQIPIETEVKDWLAKHPHLYKPDVPYRLAKLETAIRHFYIEKLSEYAAKCEELERVKKALEIVAGSSKSLLARAERAESFNAALREALDKLAHIASESGHAPCRNGGMDEEGTCPNSCICEWAQEIRTILRALSEEGKS